MDEEGRRLDELMGRTYINIYKGSYYLLSYLTQLDLSFQPRSSSLFPDALMSSLELSAQSMLFGRSEYSSNPALS